MAGDTGSPGSDALGTRLPPRYLLPLGLVIFAAFLIVPVTNAARDAVSAPDSHDALAAGLIAGALLMFLVVPSLFGARFFLRYRVYVSPDAVTRTSGDRIVQQVRFHDADDVRVRWESSLGFMSRQLAVHVMRTDNDGRSRGVWAPGLLLADVEPLMERVREEVARRPDIIAGEEDLKLLQQGAGL